MNPITKTTTQQVNASLFSLQRDINLISGRAKELQLLIDDLKTTEGIVDDNLQQQIDSLNTQIAQINATLPLKVNISQITQTVENTADTIPSGAAVTSQLNSALSDVTPTFTVSSGISLVTERCGRKRTIYINGVVCGNNGIVATYGSSDKPLSYFYETGFIQYIPSGNNETYSIVLTMNTAGELVAYFYEDGTILTPCNPNHKVFGQISYYI